jgi:tetratricopeptide (TPR) repeat protein
MIKISLGIRIDVNEGMTFSGFEEVNGLINCGGKVLSMEPFFSLREDAEKGDKDYLHLFGWGIEVTMDDSGISASPETIEHRRLFQEGSDLILPHIHLAGRTSPLADSEKVRGELERGIMLLRQVISINPANWSAYWFLGKAYHSLGNSHEAYTAFGKSFALNKENADVAREYMFECLTPGLAEKGIAVAKHAVNLSPDDAGLIANLALALLIGGKLDEAVESIAKSLAMMPDDKISQNIKEIIADIQAGHTQQPTSLEELKVNYLTSALRKNRSQ